MIRGFVPGIDVSFEHLPGGHCPAMCVLSPHKLQHLYKRDDCARPTNPPLSSVHYHSLALRRSHTRRLLIDRCIGFKRLIAYLHLRHLKNYNPERATSWRLSKPSFALQQAYLQFSPFQYLSITPTTKDCQTILSLLTSQTTQL